MTQPAPKARSHSMRPLTDEEIPYAERLGALLTDLRKRAGGSRRYIAAEAHLSDNQLWVLECGYQRTRASTLLRLAEALAPHLHESAESLHARLVETAGIALAPESPWSARSARHRERRWAAYETKKRRAREWAERMGLNDEGGA
ncbi:MAG: hypothetical protein JWM85_3487 [Acidimicrobiaceae bacterium]|nr:hypothetical protein [Acidimicrobiaceae bacterium]